MMVADFIIVVSISANHNHHKNQRPIIIHPY